jgi:3-oxoacyl-[acyl-carrier-protein] synthase II
MSAPEQTGRAVITGLGLVSCLGNTLQDYWEGMQRASPRPQIFPDPNAHMPYPLLYYVADGDVPGGCDVGWPVGRTTLFAVEAARRAMADAGLEEGLSPASVAVVLGSGMGEAGLHEQWRVEGWPVDGRWSPEFSVSAAVGGSIGAGATAACVSNACASSAFALSIAADLIEGGEADVVVSGGIEGYSRVAIGCFNRLGGVDPERCRPFDSTRAGTVFGEGAAILVMESEEHARRRGAPHIYARFSGAGWSCDAHHPTAPEPSGEQIVRALREAVDQTGWGLGAVGCVVPHGTGTELNDLVEARALREVFGGRCDELPLYSLKGLIGHSAGAAGAFAALTAALIIDRGEVPPNVPIAEQDPDCDVLLSEHPVRLGGPLVLVNAYAFGGNNVSIALESAA